MNNNQVHYKAATSLVYDENLGIHNIVKEDDSTDVCPTQSENSSHDEESLLVKIPKLFSKQKNKVMKADCFYNPRRRRNIQSNNKGSVKPKSNNSYFSSEGNRVIFDRRRSCHQKMHSKATIAFKKKIQNAVTKATTPKGEQIFNVFFNVDANGILNVLAKLISTGVPPQRAVGNP
ncbi:hypothetical protein E3N88_00668 [Mikania micrantha]|uniref:Uncharacterized protein n=1 Tax=Mikania micrantha TaxID=192012 RepID=A0A5N6PZ26_9ASTR|nr:hypothetical protein E3N88_00668 [Mikania micrantha]